MKTSSRCAHVVLFAVALVFSSFVNAAAATVHFKVATYNIQAGKGQPGLSGRPATFTNNMNCTDPSQPMNAWGVGLVQAALRRDIGADPSIIALALSESWETVCGSPEQVQATLGWAARTQGHNGIALLARYGFAGPEQWLQLDTSMNFNPSDTMWIVRAPVCVDAACSQWVAVFATHWFGYGNDPRAAYERQAGQTIAFIQSFGDANAVLAGDLNVWEDAAAVVCSQPSMPYGLNQLRGAGYLDAWSYTHGTSEGYTGMLNKGGCGNPEGYAWKRIDYVWSLGLRPLSAARFAMVAAGDEAPSDHYGVVAEYGEETTPPAPAGEILLHARNATRIAGEWRRVTDSTAAGGEAIGQADRGTPKIATPFASPSNYFELTFTARAGQPYRLWLRMKAERDYYGNDSVHVQFSDSTDAAGNPLYRIGTTSSSVVVLEEYSGARISGWGWQDNGYGFGVLGPFVCFAASGQHTIRIQSREDGASIDQIALSPAQYLTMSPGAPRDDTTILPPTSDIQSAREIVMHARNATSITGSWQLAADTTAAGGQAVVQPNLGVPKVSPALATPANYFELTFDVVAGQPYRLWLRMKAERNYYGNDSVHVQFSGAVDQAGRPVARIDTTESTVVVLEDCSGCVISGWGWQDNGYGTNVLGPLLYFDSTGRHTIRVQGREDGVFIDQIVLSPAQYLNSAPGAVRDDGTILAPR